VAHKNQEACQLYIEQEIQDRLAKGETPYSIGKDLSVWIEKLFEASIPAKTLELKGIVRRKNATNVVNLPNPAKSLPNPGKTGKSATYRHNPRPWPLAEICARTTAL
jgi:hypothetical protein